MAKSMKSRAMTLLVAAKLPKTVIETVFNAMDAVRLAEIVRDNDVAALTALPGIAEKRAAVIIAAIRRLAINGRISRKVEKRDKVMAFCLRTFPCEELFREVMPIINDLKEFYPDKDHPEATSEARRKLNRLAEAVLAEKSFAVRKSEGRITRLSRSILSDVFGINYGDPHPITELVVAEHKIQELFDFHWLLFAATEEEGKKKRDEFCQKLYIRLGMHGMQVLSNGPEGTTLVDLYGGIASSASHQKSEKMLMGERKIMAAHQKFLWLGHTMKTFVEEIAMTGAEFWKFRANIIRPILRTYKDKDGNDLTIHDVLFVDDVKKRYTFKFARRFGGRTDSRYVDGPDAEDVIMGDGAALGTDNQQGGGAGLKWMMINRESTEIALCEKYGITLEQLYDRMIKGADGKLHRYGDYKVICGIGCWKFDKAFESIEAYIAWLDEMEEIYPGISRLYVLRNSEEVEGEERVRRLTRTLIQQWMTMTAVQRLQITKKVRENLKDGKTLEGQLKKLAALWKNDEDRTELEKLYYAAPWLILNPAIQGWLADKWTKKQVEAASGKFRTEGQYPYIMQDTVALLEVWCGFADVNDPNLGLLKGDEISVADVNDKKELCCVRFPANFMTAKIMTNRAFVKAYASCGNVAIISVHSDILIRQDGDVDGDEMCILYNRIAIALTKEMIRKYNPPVILFEHGAKAKRAQFGGRKGFITEAYTALWRAKKFDSVGVNANLATACAYLASHAENEGNAALRDRYLVWMSAASTGAILAIDQVKGNAVDEGLIRWLESIKKDVRKEIKKIAESLGATKEEARKVNYPHVHYYVEMAKRRPIEMDKCAPLDESNICDSLCQLILDDTGVWEFDAQGAKWDKDAAKASILDYSVKTTNIRNGIVTQELIDEIGMNWFRRMLNSEDKKVLRNLKVGNEISIKDVALLMNRNAMAMVYSMEGSDLAEKREEYWKTCKKVLYMLADSREWVASEYAKDVPAGYVYTSEEKHASVANAILTDCLDLGKKGNNVEGKSGWATFGLNVFAGEALANIRRNRIDPEKYFGIDRSEDDMVMDVVLDILSDDEELFDAAPVIPDAIVCTPEDEYRPTNEELDQQLADYDMMFGGEMNFGIC